MKTKIGLLVAVVVAGLLTSCTSLEYRVKQQVKSMDGMSQLGTVEYTITKVVKVDHDAFYKFGERKILFSCRSYMKAGIDLADFSADDITVNRRDNSVTMELPQPKVLSFNMPVEEAKLVYESISGLRSEFTTDDRMNFLKQGEENIMADIDNLGILKDAEKNATLFFESLFAQLGVEKVNITYKKEK